MGDRYILSKDGFEEKDIEVGNILSSKEFDDSYYHLD